MSSSLSKYGECGATTGVLLLSLILSLLGIVFIYTIVGILIGLFCIVAAWVLFIIALIMLIKVLVTTEVWTNWCKANVFFCLVLLFLLIIFASLGGVQHSNQNKPNPLPANDANTQPTNQY